MKLKQVKTSLEELGWRDIMATPIGGGDPIPIEGGRYCQFPMDDEDESAPMISISDFPAGWERAPHAHGTDYVMIVLEGSVQVSGKWLHKGDVRIVSAGAGYGPLISGPDGVKELVIFREGNKRAPIRKGKARFDDAPGVSVRAVALPPL
jgi:hypothetical protein